MIYSHGPVILPHMSLFHRFTLYLMVWANIVSDLTIKVGHGDLYLWSSDFRCIFLSLWICIILGFMYFADTVSDLILIIDQ